ncbi:copper amine oxidase N-terminal domain-containing protein [Paenibacillus alvei]|uniref:Copper amine oxidase n=1 Tax=Paenibacillus alvei TaxID=44250 RepID=A0A383RLC7_PAEAL|nr:copper amine oxidase N-terminal domain-containing protein [Paenibacillus alvei]SYX87294.1 Copper amine oxidase [Paenibacillus alvei]
MKRILSGIVAVVMLLLVIPTQLQAAASISIYMDGVKLVTDQPPTTLQGRTMLPLRAIFEALDAKVLWDQRKQMVTAIKDDTTIVLKIGSKAATINGSAVVLDVPPQTLLGRTMVPVRFVSEAIGAEVGWDQRSRSVYIRTLPSNNTVASVTSVSAQTAGKYGDGRDVEISFLKSATESAVDHYRVFVVKAANVYGFTLSKALAVPAGQYTVAFPIGGPQQVSLTSNTRDVDGDLLKKSQSYAVLVLAVGKGTNKSALSAASQTLTLTNTTVSAISNVQVRDVADYGDGRDLQVSFTRPQYDDYIANYQILVVKTRDANRFDTAAANAVPNSFYTTISKSGSNSKLATTLSSSSRDVSGDYIRSDISYTVFILSVSSNSKVSPNALSAGSSSITLDRPIAAPSITKVDDVGDYGDGRDLQVSFIRSGDESKVSYYRIFVVRNRDAGNFDLSDANRVSSGRYYDVSRNGYNITTILPSNARDIQGSYIGNGETYRVFVMAVAKDGNASALSAVSSAIVLNNKGNVQASKNVTVSDVSDYNDGRDLRVSFERASDESDISQYRIMVVKSSDANRFTLSGANEISRSNYIAVSTTGRNQRIVLPSNARDVDGSSIRNGVSYQVFVLSVGKGSYSNALSNPSWPITLENRAEVYSATNVGVKDVSDYRDGRDLQVAYTRAVDESNIRQYRVLVVKSANASQFGVSAASEVSRSNYTVVKTNGANHTLTLSSDARDVDGSSIKNGVSYRVFILSVGDNDSGTNALSAPSPNIVLEDNLGADTVTNVAVKGTKNSGNSRDVEVSFSAPANDSTIDEYRILIVPSEKADGYKLSAANTVSAINYKKVSKQAGAVKEMLPDAARDVYGKQLSKGVAYQVFILSVSGGKGASNALSAPSKEFKLLDPAVPAAANVTAVVEGEGEILKVSFDKAADSKGIAYYAVMAVPSGYADSFTLTEANRVRNGGYRVVKVSEEGVLTLTSSDKDITGSALRSGVAYRIFILSIADGRQATANNLSKASNEIIPGEAF